MAFDLNHWYPGSVSISTPQAADSALVFERLPSLKFTHPLPYGAIVHDDGVQFVVMSRSATGMRVLLYNEVSDPDPYEIIDFDRDINRWGDIWSVFVPGMNPGQLYHYQVDGPWDPEHGQRFFPLRLPLLAKLNCNRCVSVAIALDVPPESQILDCGRIDDEPPWHDLIHQRADRKSGNSFCLLP